MSPHLSGALTFCLLAALLTGCTSLLPRSKEATASPWTTYRDAQAIFDRIVPGATTAEELKSLDLDPERIPNIAILNYSDVLRRFMLNPSFSLSDLDSGVRECIMAKILCRGIEVNQRTVSKHRNGNFFADVLGFRREVHTEGWRFNGLVLLKEDVVVYKLTGGQPSIREQEENANPLGPVQSITSKLLGGWL